MIRWDGKKDVEKDKGQVLVAEEHWNTFQTSRINSIY